MTIRTDMEFSLIESFLWAPVPFWSPYLHGHSKEVPGLEDYIFTPARLGKFQLSQDYISETAKAENWRQRFFLLGRHLERMQVSSSQLGFRFEQDAFFDVLKDTDREILKDVVEIFKNSEPGGSACDFLFKVRITLSPQGSFSKDFVKIKPVSKLPVLFDISNIPAEEAVAMPTHKTTLRDVLNREFKRAASLGLFDTVFMNRMGEITEGTISNVFIDAGDGVLRTPALSAGLLPGTLRAELIASGLAVEGRVTRQMLEQAEAVYLGNSVRGLVPSQLAGPF